MRRLRALAALVLLACAVPAWPQAAASTGRIEGAVLDASGAAVPGASVSARNVDTGFARSVPADGAGAYRLDVLPLGRYELTAAAPGFATLRRTGLVIQVGEALRLPFLLEVAPQAETVTVEGAAGAVEVARTLPAATIGEQEIKGLPINGRRFQDLVLLTPRTVVEAQRGGTSIGGQRGINAAYNIDGVSYDNPFFGGIRGGERSGLAYTISQEAIREFQVVSAGYSAQFGRSGGGVVNAVTKSGTNDLHGSAFWYFRNQALTADDPFGAPPTDFRQHQFGASLGGPLRKDRAHFFVAYDQQIRDEPFTVKFSSDPAGVPGFSGQEGRFTRTNDIWTAFARVDWALGAGSRLLVRYNWSRNRGENAVSSATITSSALSNNALERDGTSTLVAELQSALSPGRVNELRVQWSREDRPRQPNSSAPTVGVGGLGTLGRVTFLPSLETDDRFQVADDYTTLHGNHAFRVGFDLDFTHTQQPFFLSRSGGDYFFNTIDDYLAAVVGGEQSYSVYRQGFGRAAVHFWQKEYAAYAQDTWRARPNLTLDYGLRWEAQFEPQPDDPNPLLPGSDYIPSDSNNFGPRLGVAWDPWKDGRGVLRASAGLFYSRTPALLLVSPFTNNGLAQLQLRFRPTDPGAPVFPAVLGEAPSGVSGPRTDANTFSPDFRNPRTLQASLGAEREVRPSLAVGVEVVYARMSQLERLLDVNLAPPSSVAGDGRLLYEAARPNTNFGRILEAQSTARGDYTAATVSARRRWTGGTRWYSRGLELQAYYTLARARDDDSNERNFSATFYQDFQLLDREFTDSANDVRHSLQLHGVWSLAGGVSVGAILLAHSGTPYSRTASADVNGNGTFGDDRQFVNGVDSGRNAFRQPSFRRLDVRVVKDVKARWHGGGSGLSLGLDVFNVLGSDNLLVSARNQSWNGSGPLGLNPDLGRPDSQQGEPRTAQVSVRLHF